MSSWSAHPKKARNNIVEGFKNHPEYFQQVFADHLAWLEEKNEQQETQIVQLIGEIESLNEIISGKDEEIARLKDEIARLSSKGCTTPEAEPVSDDAQKTKALEKENSLLKSKIAQLVTTICTMTVQIRQASQLHKNEVENLTKELKTVKNERNYLKKKEKMRKNWDRQKIQDQDNTIARLQAAYDQASQALCDAQKLIEDLQEEKNRMLCGSNGWFIPIPAHPIFPVPWTSVSVKCRLEINLRIEKNPIKNLMIFQNRSAVIPAFIQKLLSAYL